MPQEAKTLHYQVVPEEEGNNVGYLAIEDEYTDGYDIINKTIFTTEELEKGVNYLISTMLENSEKPYVYDECNNAPECVNLVLVVNPDELGNKEFLCEECYQRWKVSEKLKGADPNTYLAQAQALSEKVMIPVDSLKEIFLHRPKFIPYFEALLPSKVERKQIQLADNIFLSNLGEPLFQIGHWGAGNYGSCQDWKNHSWNDGFMKSIHQLEDPSVWVMWLGESTGPASMVTRFLVREVHDCKTKKPLFGIDAVYGHNSANFEALFQALVNHGIDCKRGVVKITHPNMSRYNCATDNPAFFTSGRTSYNDIGRWIEVPKYQDDIKGVIHYSGYEHITNG